MKKKVLSLFLTLVMVLSLMPSMTFAATTVASGSCGDDITWKLNSEGVLTINGTGDMDDWSMDGDVPWHDKSSAIKTVTIGSGVTNIGSNAFFNCYNMTSVTIPAGVTYIGVSAFSNCNSLQSVILPSSVISIDICAFQCCDALTKVSFPQNMTYIGSGAFSECRGLTSVTIPDSVTYIGDWAFELCEKLTSVTIGSGVTDIGERAFSDCGSLKKITVDSGNPSYCNDSNGVLFNKNKTKLIQCPGAYSGIYTIPNSVTSIGLHAFYGCDNMTDVKIPNSVKDIGSSAFAFCDGLTSITIPSSVKNISLRMLQWCSNLKNVTIPTGVESIDNSAFCGSGLTNVSIPNSVKYIENYAFSNCCNLTNISIPDSVTNIGDFAFASCDSLQTAKLPNSVTAIVYKTFYNCQSLKSVTIPKTVKSIGEGAFGGCGSLKDVYYASSQSQWNAVEIGTNNSYLTKATIHYNATSDIKLSADTASIYAGEVKTLSVKNKPVDATVKWNCSNTSVATVSSTGKVSALKPGTATITAAVTEGGKTTKLTCKVTVSLAQAKITSITNTSTGITVKWNKVTGATAYQVYRKVGTGSWKLIKTTTSTSMTNTGLTNGTKYQYKVRAIAKNSAGTIVNKGAYSAIKTMYRLTRPTLATGTKNIATRKIVVKWNKNTKATGYQVKYVKGSTTKTVKVKGAATLSKTLSKLTKGSTYKVSVRSYKTVSGTTYYSAYSAVKSVKVAK